jgi:rRNA maturation protein Nop10
MKRFIVFAIAFALVLVSFSALAQPTPVSAQVNCKVFAGISSANLYYRLVSTASGNPVVGGPIFVSNGQVVYVPLNGPFNGTVNVQTSSNINGPYTNVFTLTNVAVNCGNDAEIAAPCDKVGADIGLPRVVAGGTPPSTTYTLNIKKNGNPFSTETIQIQGVTSGPDVVMSEKVITTLPINPSDVYTYEVICSTTGGCPPVSSPPFSSGQVVTSGTFARKCDAPPGPSHAGARLGRMIVSVPFHWAPQAGAASTFIAEAGKTFKTLGSSGGFTRVILATGTYWVPSEAIEIIE